MKTGYSKRIAIAFLIVIAGLIQSCRHGCAREGGTSAAGSKESHNMGLNCMNCHSGTGTGDGCFEIGGTVYHEDKENTYPGCTIDLFTEPNGKGTLITTLISDGKGNLYTGRSISWGKGAYPVVTSPDGQREYMTEPITSGACNNCHGNTTARIFVR
jgi:hypothetical protein